MASLFNHVSKSVRRQCSSAAFNRSLQHLVSANNVSSNPLGPSFQGAILHSFACSSFDAVFWVFFWFDVWCWILEYLSWMFGSLSCFLNVGLLLCRFYLKRCDFVRIIDFHPFFHMVCVCVVWFLVHFLVLSCFDMRWLKILREFLTGRSKRVTEKMILWFE